MSVVGSETRPVRRITVDHGWHQDDDEWRYLTGNGYVDARGFHQYLDDPGVLSFQALDGGLAARLRLRRLKPKALIRAGRLVVETYLRLHDLPVMMSLLGAAAAAVLEPFAGVDQRFALWLNGPTGSGKSFAARATMAFYGDFHPGQGRTVESWASTANNIEMGGHDFRHALYLIDDYKRELTRIGQDVRIVQVYADGQGRGRRRRDLTAAPVSYIRGLIVSTGEDVPDRSPSALGRMIVVPVPNRPKNLRRGRICRDRRGEFQGVMAGFIAYLVRTGRHLEFQGRVREQTDAYYAEISGQTNDSRIASNFGLLAAATAEFARYLGEELGVWPDWESDLAAYTDEHLVAMRDAMLRRVDAEQPAVVFLGELRDLIASQGATALRRRRQPGRSRPPAARRRSPQRPRGDHLAGRVCRGPGVAEASGPAPARRHRHAPSRTSSSLGATCWTAQDRSFAPVPAIGATRSAWAPDPACRVPTSTPSVASHSAWRPATPTIPVPRN